MIPPLREWLPLTLPSSILTDLLNKKTSQVKMELALTLGLLRCSLFPPLFYAECQLGNIDITYLEVTGKHLSSHPLVGRKVHWYLNQKTCLTLSFPCNVVWADLSVTDNLKKATMNISDWGDDPCYSIPCSTFLLGPCPEIWRETVLCFIVEFSYKGNFSCYNKLPDEAHYSRFCFLNIWRMRHCL